MSFMRQEIRTCETPTVSDPTAIFSRVRASERTAKYSVRSTLPYRLFVDEHIVFNIGNVLGMASGTLSDLLGWTSIACWLFAQFP